MKALKWGLLAAGGIARAFAAGLKQTESGGAFAVASRSKEKADRFAAELGIPRAYGNYEGLLADPEVNVVYISTPHPMHAEWTIKAADAGKHILCEKPLAVNYPDAMTMVEAAVRNDVFLMEAFMYRSNPQTAKIVELIRDGAIGDVKLIEAVFSYQAKYDLAARFLNPALGGGGILDVGCYAVSFARLAAGAALGRGFADPIDLMGAGHLGAESRVDEYAAAILRFEGDILARVFSGVQLSQINMAAILGTKGRIDVPSPWFANGREPGTVRFTLSRYGVDPETIEIDVPKGIYAVEAEMVAAHIERRQAPSPAMSWEDSLGNMKALDLWRRAINLTYPSESAEAYAQPLDRRPLEVHPKGRMQYGTIPGIDKRISRIVMGTMIPADIAHATALYDDFFSRGGNCFDTAYIYRNGLSERLLGQWIGNRGLRESVVVIAKGAHTPHCDPQSLQRQLLETLDRLGTPYADLYFMHRDNPDIPVGEFMDALNALKDSGRIRAFGGSNWTIDRVEAANAWARDNGKTGLAAVSNNFSLARMVNPIWTGSLSSSDPTYRAWHERTSVPLFAWSSTARGFFVPELARPDKTDDKELTGSWYSEENFRRQERCFDLARKRGVHPVAVALAYVLHQRFPVYALFGAGRISETRESFRALELELSPREMKWLNLEA